MKVKEEDLNKWGLTRLDVVVGVFGAIVGILFGLKYTAITFHTLIGVSAVFSGLFIGIECFFEQYKRKENPHVLKTVKSRLVKSQDKLKMTTTGTVLAIFAGVAGGILGYLYYSHTLMGVATISIMFIIVSWGLALLMDSKIWTPINESQLRKLNEFEKALHTLVKKDTIIVLVGGFLGAGLCYHFYSKSMVVVLAIGGLFSLVCLGVEWLQEGLESKK